MFTSPFWGDNNFWHITRRAVATPHPSNQAPHAQSSASNNLRLSATTNRAPMKSGAPLAWCPLETFLFWYYTKHLEFGRSITLSLSWVAFNVPSAVPTISLHEEFHLHCPTGYCPAVSNHGGLTMNERSANQLVPQFINGRDPSLYYMYTHVRYTWCVIHCNYTF